MHIINNAFKHGEASTEWNIGSLLSSLYWLFKDSPARREDFINLSDGKKLPLKFCGHRWLENVPVVERAIEIWSDVKKYISNVEKGNLSKIKNKSYLTVVEATKDKIILVKLHFFYLWQSYCNPSWSSIKAINHCCLFLEMTCYSL